MHTNNTFQSEEKTIYSCTIRIENMNMHNFEHPILFMATSDMTSTPRVHHARWMVCEQETNFQCVHVPHGVSLGTKHLHVSIYLT